MPEEQTTKKSGLSLGVWLAIIGTMLGLVTAGGGVLSQIYASKAEVSDVKEKLDKRITRANNSAETKLQNWRIQTVEVKVENMAAQQQETGDNVVRLMERFRVEPVPTAPVKPLPPPPELVADEPEPEDSE